MQGSFRHTQMCDIAYTDVWICFARWTCALTPQYHSHSVVTDRPGIASLRVKIVEYYLAHQLYKKVYNLYHNGHSIAIVSCLVDYSLHVILDNFNTIILFISYFANEICNT